MQQKAVKKRKCSEKQWEGSGKAVKRQWEGSEKAVGEGSERHLEWVEVAEVEIVLHSRLPVRLPVRHRGGGCQRLPAGEGKGTRWPRRVVSTPAGLIPPRV